VKPGLLQGAARVDIPGFRIVRPLGQGGMASVFLATQAGRDRDVALKVMAPTLADSPDLVARFLREGQISARLLHPNLARVFEVGAHGGTCYLAAEYLPGGSLRARIPGGMAVAEALDTAVDVARGLQCVHANGLVHGDVKPENILFRANGTAVLSDFGIAGAIAPADAAELPGIPVGTPAYMSPEQVRGKALDGRSDLYSLGVVLYEMLTGALPYAAADPSTLALAHGSQPVPQLPRPLAWLQPLLDGLMAKDAQARTGSGDEFVHQVGQLLAAAPEAAWVVPPDDAAELGPRSAVSVRLHRGRARRSPHWLLAALALLLGLLLLAAGAWLALR